MSEVTLRGGRGAKAQYNGSTATLQEHLRGGWAKVTLEQAVIKWRSGHWDVANSGAQHEARNSPFVALPDALLLQMLATMNIADVCSLLQTTRSLGPLRSACPFSECHLRDGMPAGYGVVASKQLRFARMLGDAHALLRSMHIDCASSEVDVVLWLLQECDCTQLSTVTINCTAHALKGQMTIALQQKNGGSKDEAVDLDDKAVVAQWTAAVPLDGFTNALRWETHRMLTGALAQHCPALESLTLLKQVEDVPSLAKIKSLRRLEGHFLELDDINYLCAELPCLTHLIVTGGNESNLIMESLDLESASLEVFDISNAAKGLTFSKIACPKLREIQCSAYSGYGNGLIVAVPDGNGGHKAYLPRMQIDPQALCIFASLGPNSKQIGTIIDLPADCVVEWGDKSSGFMTGVRATSTTTIAALIAQ